MIKVTVLNWSKFNPRRDKTKSSWYRSENSIFDNFQYKHLSLIEIAVLHFVLSCACKVNGAPFFMPDEGLDRRISPTVFRDTLSRLKDLEILSFENVDTARTPPIDGPETDRTPPIHVPLRNVTERHDDGTGRGPSESSGMSESEKPKPPMPESMVSFSHRFDPAKVDLQKRLQTMIETVVNRPIDRGFYLKLPSVLAHYDYKLEPISEVLADLQANFSKDHGDAYRMVAIKKSLGVMS